MKIAKYSILPKLISKYSNLYRYSSVSCIKNEAISTHSAEVALCTLYFYNKLTDEEKKNINIDKLMKCSILHDISEVITGDIPRPTKYATQTLCDEMHRVEDQAAKIIAEQLDDYEGLYPYITCEILNPEEKMLLKASDIYVVIAKCYQELEYGNRHFLGVLTEATSYIEDAEPKNKFIKKFKESYIDPMVMYLQTQYGSQNDNEFLSHRREFLVLNKETK